MDPKRVLVVDDSLTVFTAVKEILTPMGYEVFHAANTPDGVTQFEKLEPGIVLMDLEMPGPDGLVAVRKIRALSSAWSTKIRIIMLTSKNSKDIVTASLQAGADDFISKPFSLATLKAKI